MSKIRSTVLMLIVINTFLFCQSQIEKCRELLSKGEFSEAVAICKEYLANKPRDYKAWFILASAYEKIGDLDSAEKAAKKSLEINDEFMDAYAILVRIQRKTGNLLGAYKTAKDALNMTPKNKPKHVPLLIELGWTLLAADSADAALVVGSEAKISEPLNIEAYNLVGYAYIKIGQGVLAASNFEEAIKMDSTSLDSYRGLAEAYLVDRKYTEAAKIYSAILEKNPKDRRAQLALARLLYRAKVYDKCAVILKDYITDNDTAKQDVRLMYIDALLQSNQYDEAFKEASELSKQLPESPVIIRAFANGYYKNEQYELAIKEFNRLKKIDTLRFDDYRLLGFAYKKTKKDLLAAEAWDEALKDTTAPVVMRSYLLNEIASILMLSKKYEQAAKYFKMRFELDPTAVGAAINYAQCMMQLQRYRDAVNALKEATSRNPNSPSAHLNLGFAYYSLKDTASAILEFQRTLNVVDTATYKYRVEVAEAYRMLGLIKMVEKKMTKVESEQKWKDAIALLKKSLKYKDDIGQTHFLLGKCYQNIADFDQAMREYQMALKLDPKNKDFEAAIENLKKIQ